MSHLLTEDTLKKAGFKHWIDKNNQRGSYEGSWQKRVDGKYGRHYFINITLTDALEGAASKLGKRWEAGAQMITLDGINEDDGDTFNISLLFRPQMTLAHIETFFANTWENMNARAYEYTGESEETHMQERKSKLAMRQEHRLRLAIKPKV